VLAVVVAGLYTGYASPKAFSAQARITDRINWGTIQFLLENAVFLVIGLEIRTLIEDAHKHNEVLGVWESVGIGLLATLVLIMIRFAWAGPLVWSLRKRRERAEKRTLHEVLMVSYYRNHPVENARQRRRKQLAERRYGRMRADLEAMREQQIDWRGGVIIGWSGMRGVVTLAAAQSLPESIPYRPQLILIAFTVAVVSLIVQGGTLPALIRLLKVEGADPDQDRRQLASLLDDLSSAGLEVLDDPSLAAGVDEILDPEVVERVRQSSYLRTEAAWERTRLITGPVSERPHHLYRTLRLAVVDAERA
jgi:NhaP-type Na+/H+ or K+/H+ antiporter